MPQYIWIPPVHKQHKESMLCQTKQVSICPIHLDVPICLDSPLYVWMPSICLAAPCMFGCCHMYGGIQRYEGHPNIWGVSKHGGIQTYREASKHVGGVQTYCNIKTYRKHPNIWRASNHTGSHPNIWGHPHIQCVLPNIWGIQMYGGHMDIPLV